MALGESPSPECQKGSTPPEFSQSELITKKRVFQIKADDLTRLIRIFIERVGVRSWPFREAQVAHTSVSLGEIRP
jgi:hypothetical protein